MRQYIDEFFNELNEINDNFLTTQNKNNMEKKTKWTLVECVRYDRIYFMLKKDGDSVKAFNNYDQALDEFNQAVNFIEKDVVVMEIEK